MLSRKCTRTRSDHILESILPWPKLFKCWGDRTIFSMKWQNSCWKWDLLLPGFTACPRKGQDSSSPHTKARLSIGGCCQPKRCATSYMGVQQKGKPMKTIFARWLSILFPPQSSENRQEERRPSRPRRPVQREE